MDLLLTVFGHDDELSLLQMCARAAGIFFIALLCVRISGRRSFGMRSPFDNVTVILLGAILSRIIVGASEFLPTISAALVISILHRAVAWLSLKSPLLSRLTKGKKVVLYERGEFNRKNMQRVLVSEAELMEAVRLKSKQTALAAIEAAYMERTGEISVLVKSKTPPN